MPTTEITRTRPAMAITTPAFTRHMIFYFPDRKLTDLKDDPLENKAAVDRINEYIERFAGKLYDPNSIILIL